MSRICAVTGKSGLRGNRVSHANNKTHRRFQPNLQMASVFSDALGTTVRLRLTTHGLRTLEHAGGLDAYLLAAKDAKLPAETRRLKRLIRKARERRATA